MIAREEEKKRVTLGNMVGVVGGGEWGGGGGPEGRIPWGVAGRGGLGKGGCLVECQNASGSCSFYVSGKTSCCSVGVVFFVCELACFFCLSGKSCSCRVQGVFFSSKWACFFLV